MMPRLPKDSQPAQPERRLVRHIRLALLWAVIGGASFMAYRLGCLFAEWRQVTSQQPTKQPLTTTQSAIATAMLPVAGRWMFDDLDWSVQSTVLPTPDVASRFIAAATADGGQHASQLPDVSAKFLDLAASLRIAPIDRAGNQVYSLDQETMKAQLVTRDVAGVAKVISLAAAVRQDDNEWQFFEFLPRKAGRSTEGRLTHLLPLPPAAQRTGARIGGQGELLLELVKLDSAAADLIGLWRGAGWNIHATGLGDSEAFSYLCVRGNDTIYVWSADEQDSLHHLMLVRSSGAEDTEPGR